MANHPFLVEIEKNLKIMESEAKKLHAPVFEVEIATSKNPFKTLVFTMLSARTKDAKTLEIVEKLFLIANTPQKISELEYSKLEKILYGVGFYHTKTKNLKLLCEQLIQRHGGNVPDSLESLTNLAGVGRKTANIVLARSFGMQTIGVDVHVHRISNRLGIVKTKKPEDTEKKLIRICPNNLLGQLNRIFVAYGQTVCGPRDPKCEECKIRNMCMRVGL